MCNRGKQKANKTLWLAKTTALFGNKLEEKWVGVAGNGRYQQCVARGALDQKMKLKWAHGNLKLSLKLLTTLGKNMEVNGTPWEKKRDRELNLANSIS